MTGVWLNLSIIRLIGKVLLWQGCGLISFIRLMGKVLLWQGCGLIAFLWYYEKCYYDTDNKATVYFNPFIIKKNNTIAGQRD